MHTYTYASIPIRPVIIISYCYLNCNNTNIIFQTGIPGCIVAICHRSYRFKCFLIFSPFFLSPFICVFVSYLSIYLSINALSTTFYQHIYIFFLSKAYMSGPSWNNQRVKLAKYYLLARRYFYLYISIYFYLDILVMYLVSYLSIELLGYLN